jgi:hypothetical protein
MDSDPDAYWAWSRCTSGEYALWYLSEKYENGKIVQRKSVSLSVPLDFSMPREFQRTSILSWYFIRFRPIIETRRQLVSEQSRNVGFSANAKGDQTSESNTKMISMTSSGRTMVYGGAIEPFAADFLGLTDSLESLGFIVNLSIQKSIVFQMQSTHVCEI